MQEPDELEDDLTDSVPKLISDYATDEHREFGDRLAALYHDRDVDGAPNLNDAIAAARGKLRRGPRMHAGEFLKDGRYRLLKRLPRQGSDGYWKAWDRVGAALVFVRVFHGSWVSDADAVSAFAERGAELQALHHAGIGRVLDAEASSDGFLYLASQYFGSGSLASTEGLDTVAGLQVLVELAQALGMAHDDGVVHGDVNPNNVMVSGDGSAHVVGFMVEPQGARDLSSLYRAPEATERDYVAVPTADVYALAMTVMSALNGGELPFWVLRDPQRLLTSLDVGETARTVLAKATEWDLDARYSSMAELVADLRADAELVQSLAERARQMGRFAVAAEHYEALLTIQQHRAVEIHTILGEVYTALEDYEPAFEHLLAALERSPDVESLFPALRLVAERTKDWSRLAEALWAQARARDAARRVILRIELARLHEHKLDDPTRAAETWSQVLSDHRTPGQALAALTALQGLAESRGDWTAFVAHSTELLQYVPDESLAEIEYGIGKAQLEHLDDEEQALVWIDRAEARDHTEADMAPTLQGIRARRGQWQRVIELMAQQAEGQAISEASPTLLRAGIIATSVHLEEAAFDAYHALLQRVPRHVVALRHLARLHHRAHEHDRALEFYSRLWETYVGKDSEEPEASERAADCCAYASLMLKAGQVDDAGSRLDQALHLNPNHVPSLQLAGPLFISRGDTARAAVAFERLLALFKSVERSNQKIEACLGMGDLAWIQGRLTAAMGWYNRALELNPFSLRGWWGLAKIALSARGGHPGADRAPWVMAMPKRFTGHEALARLLAGMLDPVAARRWLELTPLGRALVEGGDSSMRLACSVVDVMSRNEVVSPDLFQRLVDACPDWEEPVGWVHRLWFEGGASTFPVARSYGWSSRVLPDDFHPLDIRSVLPPELAPAPVAVDDVRSPAAWRAMFSGEVPAAPDPFTMLVAEDDSDSELHDGPVGALVREGVLWLALTQRDAEAKIGRGSGNQLIVVDDTAIMRSHARLVRQAGRVYLEAQTQGARLQVDGEDHDVWRLVGGERVTLGETRLRFEVYDSDNQLPTQVRETPAPNDEPDEVFDEPISLEREIDETSDPGLQRAVEAIDSEASFAKTTAAGVAAAAAAAAAVATLAGTAAAEDSVETVAAVPVDAPTGPVAELAGSDLGGAADETLTHGAVVPSAESPPAESPPESPPSESPQVESPASDPASDPAPGSLADTPAPAPIATPVPAAYSLSNLPPSQREQAPPAGSGSEFDSHSESSPGVPEPAPPEEPEAVAETEPVQALVEFVNIEPADIESEPIPVVVLEEEPLDVEFVDDGDPEVVEATGPLPPAPEPAQAVPSTQTADQQPTVVEPALALPADEDGDDLPDDPSEEEVVFSRQTAQEHQDPVELGAQPAGSGAQREHHRPPTPMAPIPDVPEGFSEDSEPALTADTPSWLRRALEAEADRSESPHSDDTAGPVLIAEETYDGSPAETVEVSFDRGFEDDVAASEVTLSLDELTQGLADPPESTSVAPDDSEHVVRDAPATGVFGFPDDVQQHDPSELESESPAPALGVSGPTMVPPDDREAGPPASSLFMPIQTATKAVLEFMSGPDRGQSVDISDELSVGQSSSCGMSVPSDTRLSSVHCRVRRTPGGFVLFDEESTNGTVVNGARVTEIQLKGGEVIMVGLTVLRFRVLEEAE